MKEPILVLLQRVTQETDCLTPDLTWDHLDGHIDLLPVLGVLKLPVQDEVAVVCHHGALGQNTEPC